MQFSPALILELTVVAGAFCVVFAAAIVWRRQKPYMHREFAAAMDRICNGVAGLWAIWDDATCWGLGPVSPHEQTRVHNLCRSILQDMLRNTCFIVNRALPCCQQGNDGISGYAAEVVRLGDRLILRLRWTLLRMAFNPSALKSCRQTLHMAEEYGRLWMALTTLLAAKFPEHREALSCDR
jgi:hypothetical protein